MVYQVGGELLSVVIVLLGVRCRIHAGAVECGGAQGDGMAGNNGMVGGAQGDGRRGRGRWASMDAVRGARERGKCHSLLAMRAVLLQTRQDQGRRENKNNGLVVGGDGDGREDGCGSRVRWISMDAVRGRGARGTYNASHFLLYFWIRSL